MKAILQQKFANKVFAISESGLPFLQEEVKPENGGLDGNHKAEEPVNTNGTGSDVSVLRLKSLINFYCSSVCPTTKLCLP